MAGRSVAWYPGGTDLGDEPLLLSDPDSDLSRVLNDHSGFDAPPWSVTLATSPGYDGARVTGVTVGAGDLVVPVLIRAGSEAARRSIRDDLIEALNPRRGPGKLLVADIGMPGGDARWITAIYKDGLRGSGVQRGPGWWRFTLTLTTLDPYWYSFDPVVAVWTPLPAVPFFPFRFPWRLSPAGLVESVPLSLDGNATSWPTWQIAAPFTRVRASCRGWWWEIRRSLGEANVPLVAKTKPGEAGVRTAAGVNAYQQLVGGSQLFPLEPGDQVVVELDGGSSTTEVRLTTWQTWVSAS